jgi:two-component system KDP operon response regulator KdpE
MRNPPTEQPSSVLVVDDEAQIRRFLGAGLEIGGFTVMEAASGAEALRMLALASPDLVILDLGLPDMDGGEIVERCRSWSSVPIIVLSVRGTEREKVRLLELGADDYVVKPFGMRELLARSRAAIRRQARAVIASPIVHAGRLTVDLAMRVVSLDGVRLTLTPKEYRLLQVLASHAGKVVTHEHLLREVWGPRHASDVHYLRILIRKLRRKIETDATRPRILLNELSVGYRLAQDEDEPEPDLD